MSLYTKYDFIPQANLGSIFDAQLSLALKVPTKRGRLSEINAVLSSLRKLKVIPHGRLLYIGVAVNAAGEPGVIIVQEVSDDHATKVVTGFDEYMHARVARALDFASKQTPNEEWETLVNILTGAC